MPTIPPNHAKETTIQEELPLPPSQPLLREAEALGVLDLFAGIGGLSAGFRQEGFKAIGVDAEQTAARVYESAGFGTAHTVDLSATMFEASVPVVVGGPPCTPWSPVNQQRRRAKHEDHGLLMRFVEHVLEIRPAIFVMENVPALKSDDIYEKGMKRLTAAAYNIDRHILHYERFGAATRRRRLFTVGVRGSQHGAHAFFNHLRELQAHTPRRTVWDAIHRYREIPRGNAPDHIWSELKSIGNYRDRYETGKYGWRRLEYGEPAPSFGSVAKTYILHPEAGKGHFEERVLSVREVMAIMGFTEDVRFPDETPLAKRYQMIANAVSPQVSHAVALAVRRTLCG